MKISVVMQSFLGDYPGSRTNPEKKFARAVDSFIAQTHDDKELIIVADGCKKTFEIFEEKYLNNNQIKFCYLNKGQNKMYDTVDGKRFYRGMPKRIGVSMSDGDLVTYFDSDDIMLPDRLLHINAAWLGKEDSFTWSANSMRWLAKIEKEGDSCCKVENMECDLSQYEIDHKFVLASARNSYLITTSWAMTHRRRVNVEWKDTCGVWEDYDFSGRLMSSGKGFLYESPTYVLCHYTGLWDY